MNKEKQQIEEMAKVIASVPPIEFPIGSRMQGRHIYTTTKIAEHLYNADYRKQEWISVEDRLPDEDTRVLVYLNIPKIDANTYTFFDTDRILFGMWIRWNKFVTHWMPLPEAPKMKGGAE